jgi:5-methylcytosine-specific restriction protein A
LTVHHVIPLSDGGTHHESNLVTLCLDCHKELHGVRYERRFRRVW